MTDYLEMIKTAARIMHDKLDVEIVRHVGAAKRELVRRGVPETLADGDNPLVVEAVVTYCLGKLAEDIDKAEYYERAFDIQTDGIRKAEHV